MGTLTPNQIATGVQQIVMRLMGVMVEKQLLSEGEIMRIFAEASMTLRKAPNETNSGAAIFVDMLAAQLGCGLNWSIT